MFNQINNFPIHFRNRSNEGTPPRSTIENVRQARLDFLAQDDWESFERLINSHPELNIETEHTKDEKNYLHLAIIGKHHRTALGLAYLSDAKGLSLVNHEDASHRTPLMTAIESDHDNVELLATLIRCGASKGLSLALRIAVNKASDSAIRLLANANEDTPKLIAQMLNEDNDATALNGAKRLLDLGVYTKKALRYAVSNAWHLATSKLLLLGAKGADLLAEYVMQHDPTRGIDNTAYINQLIKNGVNQVATLIFFAKATTRDMYCLAAKRLVMACDANFKAKYHPNELRPQTRAILQLAKNTDIQAILNLARVTGQRHIGWNQLVLSAEINVIQALNEEFGTAQTSKSLFDFARLAMNAQVRTLLQAGTPATGSVNSLQATTQHSPDYHLNQGALAVLYVASLGRVKVPRSIRIDTDDTRVTYASLSAAVKNIHLANAAERFSVNQTMMLLDQGADPSYALKKLCENRNAKGIFTLAAAGVTLNHELIRLLKEQDYETAYRLSEMNNNAPSMLISLIKSNEIALAEHVLAHCTNGCEALVVAANDADEALTSTLIKLGANAPNALALLLHDGCREAASILIKHGTNINEGLLYAYSFGHTTNSISDLLSLGASPTRALIHAAEFHLISLARSLLSHEKWHIGNDAIFHVINNNTTPRHQTLKTIKKLINININTDRVLEELVANRALEKIKLLIESGAHTSETLIRMAKSGNRLDAQTLLLAGADFMEPIAVLSDNQEIAALSVLVLALSCVREKMMVV